MPRDRICTHCYYVGQPTVQGMGSFAVDALMWMIFISLSIFSSLFPLMLIPMAWTTYHILIYNKSTCPKCGRLNMVSLNSRKGRKALKGPTVVVTYSSKEDQNSNESQPEEEAEKHDRRTSDHPRTV